MIRMKTPERASPMQLAVRAVTSCLLASSGFVFALAFIHSFRPIHSGGIGSHVQARALLAIGLVIPLIVGCLISTRYEKRLRDGVKIGIWSEEQLEPLRRRLSHPLWTVFAILPLIVWCLYLVSAVRWSAGGLLCGAIWPIQMISNLKRTVAPKAATSLIDPKDWHDSAPIRSENWGESRHSSEHPAQL
jgi:hypothetical protein